MTKWKWNEKHTKCVCTIQEKDRIYEGEAHVHPDDMEYRRDSVGETIAYDRASLKYAMYMRDLAQAQFNTMKELYDAMPEGDSVEKCIVRKRKWRAYDDLADWRFSVKALRQSINDDVHALTHYAYLKEKMAQKAQLETDKN